MQINAPTNVNSIREGPFVFLDLHVETLQTAGALLLSLPFLPSLQCSSQLLHKSRAPLDILLYALVTCLRNLIIFAIALP